MKIEFKPFPEKSDLDNGERVSPLFDNENGVSEGGRKMFSGRPLCLLMLGVMLVSGTVWIGGTLVAHNIKEKGMKVDRSQIPPPLFEKVNTTVPLQCELVPSVSRFDCFPGANASQKACEARGCCWKQGKGVGIVRHDVPLCYYPSGYSSHQATEIEERPYGIRVKYKRLLDSGYKHDYDKFVMDISAKNNHVVTIQIYEEKTENPYLKTGNHLPEGFENYWLSGEIKIEVAGTGFGFRISRLHTGQILFDAMNVGGFVFSKQMLQISSLLPSRYIYGLGEHVGPFMKETDWDSYIMWASDNAPTYQKSNLYGSHPFFLSLSEDGKSHGVSFMNSHAMEVALQPTPAVTFRALGGNFHINVMSGPSPAKVIEQYTDVIGKPFLVPIWSLGYHQCKFGYGSLNRTKRILRQTMDAGIPIDTQWNDIDYMDNNKDFTYDKDKFDGLPEFVDELHKRNMHYVQIVDPGISGAEPNGTYPPYDLGVEMGIFIKNYTGQPFVGKVWNPVSTVWPDFTHPRALEYWHENLKSYHKVVPIDGVWIDMNEPANFYDGQKDGCAKSGEARKLDEPFFIPSGLAGGKLYYKTICPSAKQYFGHHYEYHNLYGLSETMVTAVSIRNIRNKRAFVVSRSTFPGQGHFGAHWTGDVYSTWEAMRFTIPSVMNFNMFGIPMVGADICGFNGNTTVELCNRWMQLGSFYPFSRNHNSIGEIDQDPVSLGPSVVRASKNALGIRYKLLPFLYTNMVFAHLKGTPAFRPLLMNFPEDKTTYNIDRQFMWGDGLMVLPVLEMGALRVEGYFPSAVWYDFYNDHPSIQGPKFETIDAPLDKIPLFVRGGTVLPTQRNSTNTYLTTRNPFLLRVYLSNDAEKRVAQGQLFYDDGDSLDTLESKRYTHVEFHAEHNRKDGTGKLVSTVVNDGYELPKLVFISIHGIDTKVEKMMLDNKTVEFRHDEDINLYRIPYLNISLSEQFIMEWTSSI